MARKWSVYFGLLLTLVLSGVLSGRSEPSTAAAPDQTPGAHLPFIALNWPSTPTPTTTPRPTQPPALFLQFANPGFEEGDTGWETYSDHYSVLITTKTTITNPFTGQWQAWMGRYPYGVSDLSAGYQGERSVIYQALTIPSGAPSFYVAFQLYTASDEWVCRDYPYAADQFRLYLGTAVNQNAIISSDDDLIGVLPICRDWATNRWVYTWLPYDLSEYSGRRIIFKFLAWNDGTRYTHVMLDDMHFITQLPAGQSLLQAPPNLDESQVDLQQPFDGSNARLVPGK